MPLTDTQIRNAKAGEKLADAAKRYAGYDLGVVRAGLICVYESQLEPAGPIYRRLGHYELP